MTDTTSGPGPVSSPSQDGDQPADGSPADGSPAAGSPVDGSPAAGSSADGSPADGLPATGSPVDGSPADGSPAAGSPADGSPADGSPQDGSPASGSPVDGSPADGKPAAGSPAGPQTSMIDYVGPSAPHLGSGPLLGLEARNVSAWFGAHKVLERVSLNMQPGRVTALIGPSGCGKSTFLRILNRMHEMVPTAALGGEVLLAGEDIYDGRKRASDIRRRIGMVFQKPNPFPAMSIYDNVTSGLKLAGIKVSSKDQVVETSLRRAGLWGEVQRRLRTPGGALSGGQQQRLCIARSLAVSPDVLLMDEPCSALDPTSTRRIEETIAEIQNQVTIVIVTHNMQQAQRVSQDCAFFLAAEGTPGHIVESGPTERMFEAPVDPRTADYVHGRFG
jgi:phosphate transport system ATP-binding protein